LDSATEAFSEKEEADTLEKVSKATSLAGADGDMMARVAPKAFANEAGHLVGEFGESLAHRMTGIGAGISVLQVAQAGMLLAFPILSLLGGAWLVATDIFPRTVGRFGTSRGPPPPVAGSPSSSLSRPPITQWPAASRAAQAGKTVVP